MTNKSTIATTQDEVIDPEAPVTRKSYDIKTKLVFIQTIDTLIMSGRSHRASCAFVGIPPLYYRHWKRLLTKFEGVNATEEFVAYSTKGTTRRLHQRHTSVLAAILPELEAFMFKIREQGIQLTNRMVEQDAARILPFFKHKTVRAKAVAVHRFTRSMGLMQHAGTHTAQKHHTQTEDAAKDFIAMMKVKLQGRNLDDVMNMDQTPIPYSYHVSKTLNPKSNTTVQGRSSTSETKHVTLAVTVTVSRKLLMPFLIFKGQ